jgi:enoyl-CoA hydratase
MVVRRERNHQSSVIHHLDNSQSVSSGIIRSATVTIPIVHHVRVPFFTINSEGSCRILRLTSPDGTNRLSRACVFAMTAALKDIKDEVTLEGRLKVKDEPKVEASSLPSPLVIAGNRKFFSVGADLNEIEVLTGPEAYEFSAMGQKLMNAIATNPAPAIAAIEGHCMGGGFDLALACHRRIAAPNATFGHRGAALGLVTGWGGTQRLPRLIGKTGAFELFITAEKISAARALEIGIVDAIAPDPIAEACRWYSNFLV